MADDDWELWYRDTFDLDASPSVDVRGRGLAQGLTELWARHLFEGVDGFSRFWLCRTDSSATIEIDGDVAGARRVRAWVFGAKTTAERGYVGEADPVLLPALVAAHLALMRAGESTAGILARAAAADDRDAFHRWLRTIAP